MTINGDKTHKTLNAVYKWWTGSNLKNPNVENYCFKLLYNYIHGLCDYYGYMFAVIIITMIYKMFRNA